MLLIAIFLVLLVTFIYIKLLLPHQYWKKKCVPHVKPMFLFGNTSENVFGTRDYYSIGRDIYNKFPNDRYYGLYQFLTPTFVVKDPDLIKLITVKDFETFPEHKTRVPEDIDSLWNKNLFSMKGHKWKEMRHTLSPAFTGSKMKLMFILMEKCSQQMISYFLKKNENVVEVELKDVFSRFTNDIIATTAFGLECDSLEHPKNEFYLMGKQGFNFTGFKMFKFLLCTLSPRLVKIFNVKIIGNEVANFFRKIIKETVAMRTEKGLVRQDMLHLLLEARKGNIKNEGTSPQEIAFAAVDGAKKSCLTDEDITAQALIFFFAGFETTATLTCFLAYELAVNPDIQERLRQEVEDTYQECDGKLTYEALMKMKYLDMVVAETLRKWTPVIGTDRIAVRPYSIKPKRPEEKPVHLEKGTAIFIPIPCIHRDSKFYPDPDKFDPERFSDENKPKILPYTYLPFGTGPRVCIGAKFALLENKTIIFHILKHFEIVPTKRSPIPMKLAPRQFNFSPIGGFWMGLKRIDTEHKL